MKEVAIAALAVLVSTSVLAQDRCKSLMESGQAAVTSVERAGLRASTRCAR